MKLDNYDKAMGCAIVGIIMPIFAFFWNWTALFIQGIAFIGFLYYSRKIILND